MLIGLGCRGKLLVLNYNNTKTLFDEIRTISTSGTPSVQKTTTVQTQHVRHYHNYHQQFERDDPDDKWTVSKQAAKFKKLCQNYMFQFQDVRERDVFAEDPETLLEFGELVSKSGYDIEPHPIETEDGYILSLYRVSRKKGVKDKPRKSKGAVLLVHGFQCAAVSWFLNSPHRTLPYMLVDDGYDCWVANLRGTPQSKNHSSLCRHSRQYWDFSWHEMGRFDVPQMISFILDRSGDDALHYVGHSMGCSVFFVAMSLRPELCRKVSTMVALGPAVYGSHVRNKPLRWSVAPFANFIAKIKYLHQQEIFGQTFSSISGYLPPGLRSIPPEGLGGYFARKYAQYHGMFFGAFGANEQIVESRRIAGHWPQSTSVKAMCHGMQCIQSQRFQNYDYGEIENLARYGQIVTPKYDLTKISCPVVTFHAEGDSLCTTKDVTKLSEDLPNLICNVGIPDPNFTHGDFIFGKDAPELVYTPLIQILNKSQKVERFKIITSIIKLKNVI